MILAGGALNVGTAAGCTTIVLTLGARVLPHWSVAFHVSVTTPPQGPGGAVWVEVAEPEMRQPAPAPLLKPNELGAGMAPQATVILGAAANVGNAAAFTTIVLETDWMVLPHWSVADHVSVTTPPHGPGVAVKVEVAAPLIRQLPEPPLLKFRELAAGTLPQLTVILAGGVLNVGTAAGCTTIVLTLGARALPQASVAFHVSVTTPPQALGGAV